MFFSSAQLRTCTRFIRITQSATALFEIWSTNFTSCRICICCGGSYLYAHFAWNKCGFCTAAQRTHTHTFPTIFSVRFRVYFFFSSACAINRLPCGDRWFTTHRCVSLTLSTHMHMFMFTHYFHSTFQLPIAPIHRHMCVCERAHAELDRWSVVARLL